MIKTEMIILMNKMKMCNREFYMPIKTLYDLHFLPFNRYKFTNMR